MITPLKLKSFGEELEWFERHHVPKDKVYAICVGIVNGFGDKNDALADIFIGRFISALKCYYLIGQNENGPALIGIHMHRMLNPFLQFFEKQPYNAISESIARFAEFKQLFGKFEGDIERLNTEYAWRTKSFIQRMANHWMRNSPPALG